MEHRTLQQLQNVAELHPRESRSLPGTKRERLNRWAEVLERDPNRQLTMLIGAEHRAPSQRDRMACKDSPMAVAFEDPVLRTAGLEDASYGAARRFFHLADWELHGIVCSCCHGPTARAKSIARRVRAATPPTDLADVLGRIWRFIVGR